MNTPFVITSLAEPGVVIQLDAHRAPRALRYDTLGSSYPPRKLHLVPLLGMTVVSSSAVTTYTAVCSVVLRAGLLRLFVLFAAILWFAFGIGYA
jgi:apolipoprotein N-acyltransferase